MNPRIDLKGEEVGVSIYCPVCKRRITASNADDVREGLADGYVFVHDDIAHDDDDIDALTTGIQ